MFVCFSIHMAPCASVHINLYQYLMHIIVPVTDDCFTFRVGEIDCKLWFALTRECTGFFFDQVSYFR